MVKRFRPKATDIIRIVLSFPLFFVLIYWDTVKTSFSPDLLWKLPAILFLFTYIIITERYSQFPKYFIFGILLAVKQLLIFAPKSSYYFKAASMGSLDLIIPVLTFFLVKYVSYRNIGRSIFFLSSWIIISTIPYHLGWLTNQIVEESKDYDLMKYGSMGKLFTGPFLSIHDAAITLSFALAGILFYLNQTKNKMIKAWIIILSFVALMSIYFTYVRTAMVMLLVGFIIQNFKGKRSILMKASMIIIAGLAIYIIYQNSSVLQMRISNTNAVGGESRSAGSGRLLFWFEMMKLIFSGDLSVFLIGIGRDASRDYMYREIGERLFAHNGIIDILISSGFIGLLFFLIFQRDLFKRVISRSNNSLPSYRLVFIAAAMYWIAIIFQGYQFIWVLIIISFFVAHLEKEFNYKKNYEKDPD